MNVVDSSGWLEYLADGPHAGFFAAAIHDRRFDAGAEEEDVILWEKQDRRVRQPFPNASIPRTSPPERDPSRHVTNRRWEVSGNVRGVAQGCAHLGLRQGILRGDQADRVTRRDGPNDRRDIVTGTRQVRPTEPDVRVHRDSWEDFHYMCPVRLQPDGWMAGPRAPGGEASSAQATERALFGGARAASGCALSALAVRRIRVTWSVIEAVA